MPSVSFIQSFENCLPAAIIALAIIVIYFFFSRNRSLSQAKATTMFNNIIEYNPYAIAMGDARGNVTRANAAFFKLFGSLPPPTYTIFSDPILTSRYPVYLEKIKAGEPAFFPEINYNPHGADPKAPDVDVWIKSVLFPVKDSKGKTEYIIGMHEDVTQRKHLEKIKDTFLETVSHELRTPLMLGKEGISQLVEGVCVGNLTEEQNKLLSISLTGINRLQHIVDKLMDISAIEVGPVEIIRKPFNLTGLASKIASPIKKRAEAKGLSFKESYFPAEISITADEYIIAKILNNLLDNAVKFVEKGDVELSITQRVNETEFCISDTGPGIASENIPKLFKKFEQIDRVVGPGEHGTGLGLAIAKGLVEAHQGKIWIESAVGHGSKFKFTIPHMV